MGPFANRPALARAILALMQTGALTAMVLDRMRLSATGREIVLPIVPSTRAFCSAEIMWSSATTSAACPRIASNPPPSRHAACYVTLEKGQDGAWLSVKLTRDRPQEASANRIVLKGRSQFGWWASEAGTANAVTYVRYGIAH